MFRRKHRKYKTFSVLINKELYNCKTITYKIKFIDSFRFISSSLSSLADNLSKGLHNYECLDCESCLDYIITKDAQLTFRCFKCKKNYERKFNKDLIKRFASIYEFCKGEVEKKVYLCEYMDSWERFDEISLPDKEVFYSSLKIKDITDVDYRHANFNNKNLGGYHDLYVQSDTLLLPDVFENFRNICVMIYMIYISTWINMVSMFKKDSSKIRIINR